jgi:formamidopyrimidine-DNA glycosylase
MEDKICQRCGNKIEEEVCNETNKGRERYYCNECLNKIFKLKGNNKI